VVFNPPLQRGKRKPLPFVKGDGEGFPRRGKKKKEGLKAPLGHP